MSHTATTPVSRLSRVNQQFNAPHASEAAHEPDDGPPIIPFRRPDDPAFDPGEPTTLRQFYESTILPQIQHAAPATRKEDRIALGHWERYTLNTDFRAVSCEDLVRLRDGLLAKPVWVTFFLGWRGGCWTPPTYKALQYMHDHLPEGFNYNTSVMDPEMHWKLLTMAILLGGHVRVGMEDNPYLGPGEYATSNAQLVEKIVRISRELGREIATPAEARKIISIA